MKNLKSGIYSIFCRENQKQYIGSSSHITKRFREHRNALKGNYHPNQYLQNAWNKYGSCAFSFKTLLYCEIDDLICREQKYLDNTQGLFNISPSAKNNTGIKFSEKHKRKLALAKMGPKNPNYQKVYTIEERLALSKKLRGTNNPMYGKHLSKEHRQKIGKANKGHIHSQTAREKISIANKGKKHSLLTKQRLSKSKTGTRNPNARAVKGVEIKTGEIKCYDTLRQTINDGFNPTCIGNCCRGIQLQHKGFKWMYI